MNRLSLLFLFFGLMIFTTGCKPSDEKITAAVQSALDNNPSLNSVSPSVNDGVVTLNGEVETEADKELAESSLSGVKGIKSINNSVTVKPSGPSPEEAKKMADERILTLVNQNLTTYKVQGVNATVEDSVVTLTGEITRANLQNAMKAASESGAARVENKMTIKR